MLNALLALAMFTSLFILFLTSVVIGRRYGKQQLLLHPENKLEVVGVAEGAIFALLGLLIAFTFSGAYERFQDRKMEVIKEANAIQTSYLRLDLLATAAQPALRDAFREYVDLRLSIYEKLPDFNAAIQVWQQTIALEPKLWKQVLAACKTASDPATAAQLIVPAFNNMFDIAHSRYAGVRVHSPAIIFALLICLAVLSSFLAGYSTANHKLSRSIYILIYVFITAFTIYIILDLEFPRVGLIRVDAFDQVLIDARNNVN